MHRSFTVTLPSNGQYSNLYSLLLALAGPNTASTYLPDQVATLEIQASLLNQSNTVTVCDSSNSGGKVLIAGDTFNKTFRSNNICLKEYTLLSSVGPLSAENANVVAVDVSGI
jgi:hypothetical protein